MLIKVLIIKKNTKKINYPQTVEIKYQLTNDCICKFYKVAVNKFANHQHIIHKNIFFITVFKSY